MLARTLCRRFLLQHSLGTHSHQLSAHHLNSMHIPKAGERAQSPAASDICTKRALWVHPGSRQQEGERRRMQARAEERSVGKECVSTCRSWWSPYQEKNKKIIKKKQSI